MSLVDRAPGPMLKRLARLPVLLYKMRLGWLLGDRFLMIVHQGRHTGRAYRTVVEVIRWDAERCEAVVASGWGEKANWYRNIQAAPAMEVVIARERFAPQQRLLDLDERTQTLRAYRCRHPYAAKMLMRLLDLPSSETPLREAATRLPMVAFSRH